MWYEIPSAIINVYVNVLYSKVYLYSTFKCQWQTKVLYKIKSSATINNTSKNSTKQRGRNQNKTQQQVTHARVNRWVLRRVLKMERLVADRTDRGKAFHSVGAATAKARSPLDFKRDRGTSRTNWSADLRALEGRCTLIRSDKYSGAIPYRDLNTNILKSILYLTGSQ